jgi:hypothetical protein
MRARIGSPPTSDGTTPRPSAVVDEAEDEYVARSVAF